MNKNKWEFVVHSVNTKLDYGSKEYGIWRLKIPGGWLIKDTHGDSKIDSDTGRLTYIPDPYHSWDSSG